MVWKHLRSGKSTLCAALNQHCESIKRKAICINLDPAAEHFTYPVSVDVRDLVTLEDAMREEQLGRRAMIKLWKHLQEPNHPPT